MKAGYGAAAHPDQRHQSMRRRDLLAVFGGCATWWPLSSAAQPAKVPTIGVLAVAAPGSERFWELFQEDLRQLGYIEGKTVEFEFRSAQVSGLPELATELVQHKVDIIVTWFTPAGLEAKRATNEIPIVLAASANPVENGLVQSLSRPGGNVTGVGGAGAELAGKCVEVIREMIPAARRVAVLANAHDPSSKLFLEQIQRAGAATGTAIAPIMIHNAEELEAAFPALDNDRPDAVFVQPSLPVKRSAELALKYRLPTVSIVRGIVDEGGLMSYGPDEADTYRRAAALVDKILKGAKPADLPVEQPTRFKLVINLKTARAIGLTIPPAFLARADEMIE
jgi:putative tryptophan/tyrosine transport system substrate-binding protein